MLGQVLYSLNNSLAKDNCLKTLLNEEVLSL